MSPFSLYLLAAAVYTPLVFVQAIPVYKCVYVDDESSATPNASGTGVGAVFIETSTASGVQAAGTPVSSSASTTVWWTPSTEVGAAAATASSESTTVWWTPSPAAGEAAATGESSSKSTTVWWTPSTLVTSAVATTASSVIGSSATASGTPANSATLSSAISSGTPAISATESSAIASGTPVTSAAGSRSATVATSATATQSSGSASTGSTSSSGMTNAVYFVNWGIYGRNFQPADLPASEITHVLYAFANIKTDGTVYLSDSYADLEKHYTGDSWDETGTNAYGCVKQLYLLKKANRNMKVLLSIGGWTYSTNFAAAASSDATRSTFATTATKFVSDLGLDGIDIDWEYPASDTEAANFVLLIKACRSALDTYSAAHASNYHFQITVASPAGPKKYNILHLSDMDSIVDSWHLMSYDYAGSWDTISGNSANIYPSTSNNNSTPFSTDVAITAYLSKGVTASKIVMGIPLYGRSFEETSGLGQSYTGVGTGSWEVGVWDYKVLPKSGATENYDSQAGATWSYDSSTKELISYDTVAMAQNKAKYVQSKGLGGAMYWEASGDRNDTGSIIASVKDAFGSLESSQNLLSYPESMYANIAAGCSS